MSPTYPIRAPQERDTEAKVAEGKVANPEPSSSSLQKDISSSEHSIGIQPTTKDALSPRSPTPTMKTDSVDTDSASISASTSPAPSSSNPSPPPHQAATILNPQLQVALKLLVSNSASGYIIGRSGKTVSDLQTKSLARIKLSQGGDYYPGTTDRVCLILGMLSNVSVALQMILIKLHEVHSHQRVPTPTKPKTCVVGNSPSPPEDETASTSPFVVKILIPSSCCGMMIGLGGSNIKALKDKSPGVTHIQLSPKDDEVRPIGGGMSTLPTSERIMTIAGSSYTSCLTCIQLILNDMAINPEIARYLNMTTSYSRNIVTTSPMVPSAYVAAPTAAAPGIHSPSYQYPPVAHQPGQFQPSSPPRSAQNMSLLSQELMHHQGDVSALSDPSSQSSQPSQGMMLTPPRVSDLNQNPSSFPQYQPGPPTQYWSPSSRRMSSSSGHHNISPVVDQLSHNFQAQASIQRYQSSSSLQEMTPQQLVTVQLGVADTRIGSILGHGGKKLTEIQSLSHTKIRISQRGDFIPNTQNRIVTITGSTAKDVEHAQQLIIKRLAGGDLRASFS